VALGDRRADVRLEVVGALWATLEMSEPARVVNISENGALIASPLPMSAESVQPMHLNLRGRAIAIDARVRHVSRVASPDAPTRYMVGVEFLSSPPELAEVTGKTPA